MARVMIEPQRKSTRGPDTIIVGTYPPTRCGLATFTANTRRGLLAADPTRDVAVLRVGAPPDDLEQKVEVHATWPHGGASFAAAAACDDFDVVLLQHEFGIYNGVHGAAVLDFAGHLRVPLVTVLHTVLVEPKGMQRSIIEELAARSAGLIVLCEAAADRLADRYRVDARLVTAIPHGADLNFGPEPTRCRRPPMVLTWGLIGPGKGIEHAIKAVADLAGRGLRVRYVVAGQTHPKVLAAEGERYRCQLRKLAQQLGVGDLIDLDDRYRSWSDLHALVRECDLVVLPYDSREQVTSGVLVEALASGKPLVSTAFPHAVEVVADRAGIVVPHEEAGAIASAIQRLLTDPLLRRRCARAARHEGRRHAWPAIGARYDTALREALSTVAKV